MRADAWIALEPRSQTKSGVIAFRGIQTHYVVGGDKAVRILVIAIVLFYLVPIAVIVLAAVAIVIAAIVLNYF